MAIEGNFFDSYDMKIPDGLTRKGRRLVFRLWDKFKIGPATISDLCRKRLPGHPLKDILEDLNVEDIVKFYLQDQYHVTVTNEQCRRLIQVLDFDTRVNFYELSGHRVMELLLPPKTPTNVVEAQQVAIHDYERGHLLGEKLLRACEWLIAYSCHSGQKLVVYGRDGEIIYDTIKHLLIKYYPKAAPQVKFTYIVLSRNQLRLLEACRVHPKLGLNKNKRFNVIYKEVHGKKISVDVSTAEYEEYIEYIKEAVDSPNVIHVDTGISGTVQLGIHKFLYALGDKRFAQRPNIKMLSSQGEQQIPTGKMSEVIDAIEHKDQTRIKAFRLQLPTENPAAFKYAAFRIGVFQRISERMKESPAPPKVAPNTYNFLPYTSGSSKLTLSNKMWIGPSDIAVNDPDDIPF